MVARKRDLLSLLNKCQASLTGMAADLAELEFKNNDQASRRAKKAIIDFDGGPLDDLRKAIKRTREEINSK